MSTTNNVTVADFQASSSSNIFNCIWRLTRAMKKAGWKYLASSDGSTKDTSADPANDKWNANTTTNAGGSAASIATPSRGRATVTGLSGIVSADKGRFLVISGGATSQNNHAHQIEEIVSSTSVRVSSHDAFTLASDANNGTLTWSIVDPGGNSKDSGGSPVYPSALSSVIAWILFRGPSLIKIPITAAQVNGLAGFGFIRGENVVQATTGAEGEICGYIFDGVSSGYIVVAPRLRGTGAGPYGWDTANAVVGSSSGASITQVGTALEYRCEMMIAKGADQTHGLVFIGNFEPVGDSAQMFSTIAQAAGCTATVPPGGGGTGNSFPTLAYVSLGVGGTTIANVNNWDRDGGNIVAGFSQMAVVDLIEEQNYSADGSFFFGVAHTTGTGGTFGAGFGYLRMDDNEDGDLDPYVNFGPQTYSGGYGTNSRTASVATNSIASLDQFGTAGFTATNVVAFRGWRRRGLSSGDTFLDMEPLADFGIATNKVVLLANTSSADAVATAPSYTKIREAFRIASLQTLNKTRKGTARWWWWTQGGSGTDTYDNKKFVQMSAWTSTGLPAVVGPWDQTTTPTVS